MNKEFWKDKRVLITGHTGFKGSWLTLWLDNMGAKVVGLSVGCDYDNGIYALSDIKKNIKDLRGDIRNYKEVEKIFEQNEFDIIFHLAAQPLVSEGYLNPIETYETNIIGTQSILECIRKNKEK